MVRSNDIARKAVTDSFQLSADYVEKNADLVSSAVTDTNADINLVKKLFTRDGWNCSKKVFAKKLKNPLYICTVCSKDADQHDQSIMCNSCLEWYHVTCARLKNPPKSKFWFCSYCKE
jgi:hypothetical protein